MSVSSYSFHSLLLKLPNKRMSFSFLLLKLPNKGREEYYKIILFIFFHSISFTHSKQGQAIVNNSFYKNFNIIFMENIKKKLVIFFSFTIKSFWINVLRRPLLFLFFLSSIVEHFLFFSLFLEERHNSWPNKHII